MKCKKCDRELTNTDLLVTWYDNGVVFLLKCDCGYYFESQISGAATMYKYANGFADSRKDER